MRKQLEVPTEVWDREFKSGRWDCLDDNPAERARHAVIGMYARRYFPKGRVLDVGCGEGTLVDFLTGAQREKYVGIDISAEALKKGKRKRKGIDFRRIPAESFQADQKFDAIVFNEILYYVDDADILAKYSRFLKRGGKVIISVYRMSSERHDKQIIKNSRKHFAFREAVEVTGEAGGQKVTWRIEVLDGKKP
jgi:2-polyprenyl-3-methyl-5-hydroxy-6-metoxy-1,4-benzoquinol methylase